MGLRMVEGIMKDEEFREIIEGDTCTVIFPGICEMCGCKVWPENMSIDDYEHIFCSECYPREN